MTAPIDLRSDTVTRPTDGMRAAMAAAPVGDDQYGEDVTTNRLQARMAELLGKEAALWLPTGTMANQVALRTLTKPGDEVVASFQSHVGWHEVGGRGRAGAAGRRGPGPRARPPRARALQGGAAGDGAAGRARPTTPPADTAARATGRPAGLGPGGARLAKPEPRRGDIVRVSD